MFRHVVTFSWNETSSPAHITELKAALSGLPAAIPEIRRYHFGSDAAINEGNSDFAVVAEFDDRDGYLVYRDDPEHGRVIAGLIAPYLASRTAVQFDSID